MARLRRGALAALFAASGVLAAACGTSSGSATSNGLHSIVQLGDSVASGEGTLYGYRYDTTTRKWTGGNVFATWPGPYPQCHVSPDAYGTVLANELHAKLAQFACTGSTFTNGIAAPRVRSGATLRPAQFGNWATRTDLNPAYDSARPQLVLVTFGADDVQFSSIVTSCVEDNLAHRLDPTSSLQCTSANPGPTVESDALSQLGTLSADITTLAHWIVARGTADHHVPKIVFTNYFDPLPAAGHTCPDSDLLATSQVGYLSSLLEKVDSLIIGTVDSLHESQIMAVDLQNAFNGHRWCSNDPWAYGLSIYNLSNPTSLLSEAPFHPTPRGQQQIAAMVKPAITRLFSNS